MISPPEAKPTTSHTDTGGKSNGEKWLLIIILLIGILAIALTLTGGIPETSSDIRNVPIDVLDTCNCSTPKDEEHRGRLQVQGKDLKNIKVPESSGFVFQEDTLSWSWSRKTPPTALEALEALNTMKTLLSPNQLKDRELAFKSAEVFIMRAVASNGVYAPVSRTFQNANLPKIKETYRVDLEVKLGKAFV